MALEYEICIEITFWGLLWFCSKIRFKMWQCWYFRKFEHVKGNNEVKVTKVVVYVNSKTVYSVSVLNSIEIHVIYAKLPDFEVYPQYLG